MNQTALQQLRNILVDGKFPSKKVNVKGIPFIFTFTDKNFYFDENKNLVDYVEFFSKVITYNFRGKIIPITDFLGVYMYPLQKAYFEFQYNMTDMLLKALAEFVKSNESNELWLAYTHSNSSDVLTINKKLNLIQKRWIALNTVHDKEIQMQLISNIFDGIKPWLDKELFAEVEKQNTDTRENAFYDDATIDQTLREKANRLKAQKNTEPEPDIVILEEEE